MSRGNTNGAGCVLVHCDVAARVENDERKITLASRESSNSFRFELAIESVSFAKRWRGCIAVPLPEFKVSFLIVSCCASDYDESFTPLIEILCSEFRRLRAGA